MTLTEILQSLAENKVELDNLLKQQQQLTYDIQNRRKVILFLKELADKTK